MDPLLESDLLSRRQLLTRSGAGFGGLALHALLAEEARAEHVDTPLAVRAPHFPAQARAVIWLFMGGGPSQVDTWDYKPELTQRDGQPLEDYDPTTGFFDKRAGALLKSPFRFDQHGESGAWVSDLFPHIARHVDKLAIIKSCFTTSNNHTPAIWQLNSGLPRPGFPPLGSWLTYGLGTENQNLPGFVVMTDRADRGLPKGDTQNWASGFLPAVYQGAALNSQGAPIDHLAALRSRGGISQRQKLDALAALNDSFARRHPGHSEIASRMAAFELAYRMQTTAPEAFDVSAETRETQERYGLAEKRTDRFGRQCLMARRLVERGVRFIQIYSGGGTNPTSWDAHNNLVQNHRMFAGETDKPIAGLLADLEERGLLDSTLVIWGGEFGRTPVTEGRNGRDHNPFAFTTWMAGGGIRGGVSHGETDEVGWKAVQDRVSVHDLHATILHLLGLDHKRLTWRHNGRDFRLTDVHGELIEPILRESIGLSQKGSARADR